MRITKSDVRASSILAVAALLIGMLGAHSTGRWMDGVDRGSEDLALTKKELLASAGLLALHHTVYAKVGEERWESQVKSAFLSAITRAAVKDTGEVLPSWQMVVEWVRAHPEEARRMLKDSAGLP